MLMSAGDESWWYWIPGWPQRLLTRWWGAGPPVTMQAQIDSIRMVRDAYVFAWGAGSASRGAQILTLDRIDAGSAYARARSVMAISYPVNRPRKARLSNG
jgi:hypothetical protein